jgi:hypothetical protein
MLRCARTMPKSSNASTRSNSRLTTGPIVAAPGPIRTTGGRQALKGVCSMISRSTTGVAPFVDVAVTSARAGYRKPHPGICEATLGPVGLEPVDAVLVGGTWGPDVVGRTGRRHDCRSRLEGPVAHSAGIDAPRAPSHRARSAALLALFACAP